MADHETYQRATTAALVGLIVQLLLAVVIALVGLWAASPALYAVTFHLFGGLPIWLVLLMLYNQHRLESIESLETEQIALGDQPQRSELFTEQARDAQLAQRRLDNLYKFGLGSVSFIVAIYLLVVGSFWLYRASRPGAVALGDRAAAFPLGLATMLLAVAFVSFVVARYVAGMTRQRQWQMLRGGASYLMGTALLCILVAIGGFGHWMKLPSVFEVLAFVVPVIMVWLGGEIVVTFMLSAYRPRRPGEIPRPAFDSRSLGLLTSPVSIAAAIGEAVNYQFGFEVSRSWFYQLLSRAITPLVVFGIAVLVLISSVVVVEPHEKVIITRFGELVTSVDPGVHLKWPWPISRASKYPVAHIHQISVGSVAARDRSKPILWTTEHAVGGEEYLVTGASDLHAADDGLGVESKVAGVALIAVEVVVHFRISDVEKFVRHATRPMDLVDAMRQRERWAALYKRYEARGRRGTDPLLNRRRIDPCPLLSAIANRRVNAYCAKRDIDTLLASGRGEAGQQLRSLIQDDVNEHDLGLEIVFVGVAGIHPPQQGDVAATFHQQIGALQESQVVVETARRVAIGQLAEVAGSAEQAKAIHQTIERLEQLERQQTELQAGGDAAGAEALEEQRLDLERQINGLLVASNGAAAAALYDAHTYRWKRVIDVYAEVERYDARLEPYRRAPQYYLERLFFETLAKSIEGARKIVVSDSDEGIEFWFNLEDTETHLGSILGQ